MVFLDENAVEQAHAMIVAAADPHRVFLRRAQARDGFAGVEQPAIRAFEQHRIGMRGAWRCRAEQLQEIERGALARSAARAPGPRRVNKQLIGRDGIALGDPPIDPHPGIDLA